MPRRSSLIRVAAAAGPPGLNEQVVQLVIPVRFRYNGPGTRRESLEDVQEHTICPGNTGGSP
jgi:hypothetical protein